VVCDGTSTGPALCRRTLGVVRVRAPARAAVPRMASALRPCRAPTIGAPNATKASTTWSTMRPNTIPAHLRAPGTSFAAKKDTISRISPRTGITYMPIMPWSMWPALPS
jgi:hypothetical protein